jgi:hypothetical protein
LNHGIVDKNVHRSQLLGGLAHISRSLRITEVAAEGGYSTSQALRSYLAGDIGERRLIARDQQQIGAMRGKLVSTKPTQAAACSRDEGQHPRSVTLRENPAIGSQPIDREFHGLSDAFLWLPAEPADMGGIEVNQRIVTNPSLPSTGEAQLRRKL